MKFSANDVVPFIPIEDARKGLEDIKAGRVQDADKAIAMLQQRRKANSTPAARKARLRH